MLRHMKRDGLLLPRQKMNPGKALQRALRSFNASHVFSNIKLRHFISFTVSGVHHVDRGFNVVLASSSRNAQNEMIILEGCVAQAKSEAKERLSVVIDVFRLRGNP
jgi:hypothetical protein